MSETTEKIIFSVQIDQSDAINKVANLTKEINALKESNAKLAKAEGDNSKAIAENNVLIQAATNERSKTNKAIVASVEAFGKEAKSIDDARTAVKQLTIERNKLDLSTEEGKKKQTELNNSIDQHNKFIKENVDQYQQQKINIGNYAGALKDLKSDLKSAEGQMIVLAQTLGRTSTEYQAAAKRAADLKDIIKDTKEDLKASQGEGFERLGSTLEGLKGSLMDLDFGRVKEQINQLQEISKTTTFAGMIGGVGGLGASLKTLATTILTNPLFILAAVVGGVAVAFKGFYDSLDAGKEILKIGREGVLNLKNQYDELTVSIKEAEIENDVLTGKISKASGDKLKNQEKFKQEYIKIIKAATDEEKKITDAAIKERDEDSFKGTKNLLDNLGFQTATTKATAESIAAIEKQKQENILLLRKKYSIDNQKIEIEAQNEAKTNNEKTNNDYKKSLEDKAKIKKENDLKLLADLKKHEEDLNALLDLAIKENKEESEKDAQRRRLLAKQQVEVNQEKNKMLLEDEQKTADEKKQLLDAQVSQQNQATNAIISILALGTQAAGQQTEAGKALAIVQATISTWFTAQKAYESAFLPVPTIASPVIGAISSAAAVATGLFNVSKIAGISAAAGGGDFMTTGPTLLLVGDNPGGRERVKVEPISGKGQTTINPNSGLVAMAGGGTLTTSGYGGYAERNGGLKTMIDYNQLAKAMQKAPAPIVQISELNKKQASLSKVSKTVNITD